MAVIVISPLCADQIHKRAGWTGRRASPAVAIVRQRGYRGRWTLRCDPCVQKLRTANVHFDLCYLDPARVRGADPDLATDNWGNIHHDVYAAHGECPHPDCP
jgi:hypothetical protein